jgi:hypothetical protein
MQWNTRGIELVSRVLPAPDPAQTRVLHCDPALVEVRNYLTALKGNSSKPYGEYTNPVCGLQLHVGLDPKQSNAGILPLDLLQHLSYILAQFETSISALHPRNRRSLVDTAMSTGTMLASNLMGLRRARHICDKILVVLLDEIQDRIFAKGMTIEKLAKLMSETMRGVPVLQGGGANRYSSSTSRDL